jgi:hypothetical protein
MAIPAGSDSRIDSYLARVRAALGGLPEREIDDVLRELRSHADELSDGRGVDAALHSLGDPVDLARTYRAENSMARAECSGSPLVILLGLRNAARSGLGRIAVTALYAFGYANILALWAIALDKLLAPSRTGLWYIPGNIWSLRLIGDQTAPPGARELLGWWLVPLALAVGWVLRYPLDSIAQWWIRRMRTNSKKEKWL